jgi:hypothetical protein
MVSPNAMYGFFPADLTPHCKGSSRLHVEDGHMSCHVWGEVVLGPVFAVACTLSVAVRADAGHYYRDLCDGKVSDWQQVTVALAADWRRRGWSRVRDARKDFFVQILSDSGY